MTDPGRSAARYCLATLAWTWGLWVPLIVLTNSMGDVTSMPMPMWQRIALLLWLQLGGYGPSIVAILLSMRRWGGAGVSPLLRKLLIWQVPFRWYVVR